MDDVVGYAWHGEIADNPNNQKDQVGRVGRTKECITVTDDLLYVDFQHVFLNLAYNTPEYVSYW